MVAISIHIRVSNYTYGHWPLAADIGDFVYPQKLLVNSGSLTTSQSFSSSDYIDDIVLGGYSGQFREHTRRRRVPARHRHDTPTSQ